MRRETFPKWEHLTGDKSIAGLFSRGEAFIVFPLRVVYLRVEREDAPVRVMFAVPKRHFRHAVDRNRMKRLMRESYRKQKSALIEYAESNGCTLHVAVSLIRPMWLSYGDMYIKMGKIIRNLADRLAEGAEEAKV